MESTTCGKIWRNPIQSNLDPKRCAQMLQGTICLWCPYTCYPTLPLRCVLSHFHAVCKTVWRSLRCSLLYYHLPPVHNYPPIKPVFTSLLISSGRIVDRPESRGKQGTSMNHYHTTPLLCLSTHSEAKDVDFLFFFFAFLLKNDLELNIVHPATNCSLPCP